MLKLILNEGLLAYARDRRLISITQLFTRLDLFDLPEHSAMDCFAYLISFSGFSTILKLDCVNSNSTRREKKIYSHQP
jgi:hypothetical protein